MPFSSGSCSGRPGAPGNEINPSKYLLNLLVNDCAHGSPIKMMLALGYALRRALTAGIEHNISPSCSARKMPIFCMFSGNFKGVIV